MFGDTGKNKMPALARYRVSEAPANGFPTNGNPVSNGNGNGNGAHHGVDLNARVAMLQKCVLFRTLPQMECAEIARLAQVRAIDKRKIFFREGEPVQSIFLLTSGCAKLTQLSLDGNEVILRLNGSGEVIGALGAAARTLHTFSVYALERCETLAWDTATFDKILERYREVRANTVQLMAMRLQELEERFRELATEKVAPRVAHQLVRLFTQIGKPVEGGVDIALSREELAQLTGTTLFTISRLLSAWHEQGLVMPRREAVRIRRASDLAQIGEDWSATS